jgi:phage tail P2-like protein
MTSLLPPNRTPLELALSETIAARFPRPIGSIRTVFDADTCPADLLPFLAWELSVDLWDERWHEVTKRQACRDAMRLHALKTTLAGIKAHVALVGCEVIKAVRPPAITFAHPAMTEAQQLAWRESLPQIRLYPYLRYGLVRSRSYYRSSLPRAWEALTFDADGDSWTFGTTVRLLDMAGPDAPAIQRPAFYGHGFHRTTRGSELLGTRATYWDRGEEREIRIDVPEAGITRLLIPRSAKRSWFGHAFAGHAYFKRSQAALGVVTVRLSDDVAGFAIAAGMTPIDVSPDRISQHRVAPAARAFFGRPSRFRYMQGSAAPRFIYDRVSIHVPDRMGARRRARSYFGHARFGMPAYSAELKIHVPMLRPRCRSGRFYGAGYMKAADMRPFQQMIEAVRVSKAFRDTIRIDTRTHERVQFSGGLRFGEFTFGEIRRTS